MEGQGEFEFEVTTQNTGSFEWTLRTEHDEDAYENWDNLWADIEMEVEEQVSSRWEDELDPGYGGHNPGFGDGFEVTLELTKEGAKEHGVEQEEAWVDWTAGSSSPWYSAENKAADWSVDKEYLIGGGNSILTHDDVCPSCKEGRMEAGNDSYGVEYLGCSKCGYGDSTPMSDLNCPSKWSWSSSSLEHDWVPYAYQCEACGLIEPNFSPPKKKKAETETFESPVSCNICGKTFDSFRGLNGHMNAHIPAHRRRAEGREETQRMTRPEAEALADKVVKLVTPYVDRVEVCGSYRRGSPRPGDLDVVIIPKKGVTLPEIVKAIKHNIFITTPPEKTACCGKQSNSKGGIQGRTIFIITTHYPKNNCC